MPGKNVQKTKKSAQTPKKKVQVKKSAPKPVVKKKQVAAKGKAGAAKKAPLKKAVKAPAKQPAKKPALKTAKPAVKAPAKEAAKPQVAAVVTPPAKTPSRFGGSSQPQRRQALSIQPGSGRRQGPPIDPNVPMGIDRTRLGAIQARLFRPGAMETETRQKLALMVSAISVAAGKQKIVKSQITEELARFGRAVKANLSDAQMKAEILNDIDAFSAVVKNH